MNKYLLICLTMVAFLIRFYQVGKLPVILNRDEAALAYNGALLQETGQDEWGRRWPLALESFGDFKLPGYPMMLAALFKILPLEDWVVRLPSVVAGATLIPISYFFARRFKISEQGSLMFAGLLTVTPVFFFYSRIAYEANVALTLFIWSLALLLTNSPVSKLKEGSALVILLVAIFTYNTPLLLLPFMIPVVILWRGGNSWKKWLGPTLGLGLLFFGRYGYLVATDCSKKWHYYF